MRPAASISSLFTLFAFALLMCVSATTASAQDDPFASRDTTAMRQVSTDRHKAIGALVKHIDSLLKQTMPTGLGASEEIAWEDQTEWLTNVRGRFDSIGKELGVALSIGKSGKKRVFDDDALVTLNDRFVALQEEISREVARNSDEPGRGGGAPSGASGATPDGEGTQGAVEGAVGTEIPGGALGGGGAVVVTPTEDATHARHEAAIIAIGNVR